MRALFTDWQTAYQAFTQNQRANIGQIAETLAMVAGDIAGLTLSLVSPLGTLTSWATSSGLSAVKNIGPKLQTRC